MRAAWLLTLFITSAAAVGQGPPDETAKDAAALKATWEVVSAESDGAPAKDAFRSGTVIVIEADTLYFTDGFAKSGASKFKLDASTKPRSIDIESGKDKQKVVKGIYSLEMDSLKLCLGLEGVRPNEFKTKPGDKTSLLILKRQKPSR